MAFTSLSFLVLFLPLSGLLYWRLSRWPRLRLWLLLALSLLFYNSAGLPFLLLLLGLSLVTFLAARKGWSLPAIALNLAALGVFKYWDFGAHYTNRLLTLLGFPAALPIFELLLPLGISYYVFKHIGYLLDIRAKRYPAATDLPAFLTYSAFFPQISAGPLSNYNDTGEALRSLPERLSKEQAWAGLASIAVGLSKKLLIADQLAASFGSVYAIETGGLLPAWLMLFAFGLQLYFDFSAYTDIAIGVGLLFGIQLPPNFNNPYLAATPAEFWQRWHISLSRWFRIYLFTPLSRSLLKRWGSRGRERAQYSANLVTMGLVGLWHGAGFGFIFWGIYHGILLNLGAWLTRKSPDWSRNPLARLLFFLSIFFGWGLFLSPSLTYLRALLLDLLGLGGLGTLPPLGLPAGILLMAAAALSLSGAAEAADMARNRQRWAAVLFGLLLALGILLLGQPGDFAYVQF